MSQHTYSFHVDLNQAEEAVVLGGISRKEAAAARDAILIEMAADFRAAVARMWADHFADALREHIAKTDSQAAG